MHESYLPTFLMRPLRIIFKRTRTIRSTAQEAVTVMILRATLDQWPLTTPTPANLLRLQYLVGWLVS